MHELWHVVVLAAALFGAAGAAILTLSSLIFESTPPGVTRARPALLAMVVLAALVVAAEWFVVH